MVWVVARSLLAGLAGLVALPIVVFFATLVIAHAVDSRCGTPGDSGGCEMGAASIAIFAAPFGFLIGFAWSLFIGLRKRALSTGNTQQS